MNKKYYLIIIMSLLLVINSYLVLGNSLNYKINYDGSCYQETANINTACGGLDSGNYNTITATYIYINYTKPLFAYNNSLWMVKHGGTSDLPYNISIPNNCFNQIKLMFRMYTNLSPATLIDTSYVQCYNGTTWQTIGTVQSGWEAYTGGGNNPSPSQTYDGNWNTHIIGGNGGTTWYSEVTPYFGNNSKLFEEAMWWNLTTYNNSINYYFSPNLSYLNEPITLYLNTSTSEFIDYIVNNYSCYQETANISTACGGLSTGNYSINASTWSGNGSGLSDGNWSSFSFSSANNFFLINYSKPINALNNSLWQIKSATNTYNFSIPLSCWNNSNTIMLRINSSFSLAYSLAECYNGSAWISQTIPNSGFYSIFEEAMWWNINNISQITNYNNTITQAILFFNGTNYGITSYQDFGSNRIFSRTLNPIFSYGNYSYYWNISTLQSTGEVFNFTLNNSIQINSLSFNISYFDINTGLKINNVTAYLIGDYQLNYSTNNGNISINNVSIGQYTLISNSNGYLQNTYVFYINSTYIYNLSVYLQPNSSYYYALITIKDKYGKSYVPGAILTIQKYVNNAWITDQVYVTDFNGQTQGYFVIDTAFYNFVIEKDGNVYFGVINGNANKKIIYSQDILNGINIEIDLSTGNDYFDFLDVQNVYTGLNYTNLSSSYGYFSYRFLDNNKNRNATLLVLDGSNVNCSSSVMSSSGILICYINSSVLKNFKGIGYIDGYSTDSYIARIGSNSTTSFNWGVMGWFVSLILIIIAYFGFSEIPSMSILMGTGIMAVLSLLNLIFQGINMLMFIGFLAVAFIIAKIPSRQGGNG